MSCERERSERRDAKHERRLCAAGARRAMSLATLRCARDKAHTGLLQLRSLRSFADNPAFALLLLRKRSHFFRTKAYNSCRAEVAEDQLLACDLGGLP